MVFLKRISYYLGKSEGSLFIIIGVLLSRGLPFLLVPLITSYLSPSEYGYLAYIGTVIAFATIYSGFQQHLFFIVKWGVLDPEQKSDYLTLALFLAFFSGIIVGSIFEFGIKPLISVDISLTTVFAIILIAISRSIFLIFDAALQSERQLKNLSLFMVAKTIIHYGLAVYFLDAIFEDWRGKFYAELVTAFASFIAVTVWMHKTIRFSFRLKLSKARALLKYSFPLTFHVLGITVMGSIDRIMIAEIMDLKAAGIYAVGYLFGSIVGMIHHALTKVWNPIFYEKVKTQSYSEKLNIVLASYGYITGSILILALFVIFMPFIFVLILPDSYHSGVAVIPIIAIGCTIEAVRKLFVAYLFLADKVKLIAVISIIAALINVTLNYILIPVVGLHGAAWATALTYLMITAYTIFKSSKTSPMPWFAMSKLQDKLNEFIK
jgi:O-antigen/teichoic acid export membrane protein